MSTSFYGLLHGVRADLRREVAQLEEQRRQLQEAPGKAGKDMASKIDQDGGGEGGGEEVEQQQEPPPPPQQQQQQQEDEYDEGQGNEESGEEEMGGDDGKRDYALANVDMELEAKRRMLELVEATERQLQDEWQRKNRPAHSPGEGGTEVRSSRGESLDSGHPQLTCVSVSRQPTSGVPAKRSLKAEPLPEPLPARPLPMAVWEDHLLPLLTCKEAARLGCTCKAMRVVVREHFAELGDVFLKELRAALTTFPGARSMSLDMRTGTGYGEKEAVVEWLRNGGHGGAIATMTARHRNVDTSVAAFVHAALRSGALPSLKSVAANLEFEDQCAILTEGLLRGMHELQLKVPCGRGIEPQLAALGHVRQLPALTKLDLELKISDYLRPRGEWPLFIPASLKTLRIVTKLDQWSRSLLSALPDMLVASGASLERLEVHLPNDRMSAGKGMVCVAQALRCCSPTLKGLRLVLENWVAPLKCAPGYASKMEGRRAQWAELLAGVSTCRELEKLVFPNVMMEPLFPRGTAFGRLTHLEMSDHEREHVPDAGEMGLWELMASGGLPALATLHIRLVGRLPGEGVKTRVAPAFEAVAGTLTHLSLANPYKWHGSSGELEWGYEMGVAIGKLRRLRDLTLDLSPSEDGRVYPALAQGLAAGGGDCPLPLLRRVVLPALIRTNADLLASLLLPSVEVFETGHSDASSALLTACALIQVGFKHTWAVGIHPELVSQVRAVAPFRVCKVKAQSYDFPVVRTSLVPGFLTRAVPILSRFVDGVMAGADIVGVNIHD
jgi:hypothetical protein